MTYNVARLGRASVIFVFLCAPMVSAQKAPKPATQQEESYMLGRIVSAIEDTGAYTKEALRKFAAINKDIEKRQYSARNRWLAHHWYGKALLDDGKPSDSVRLLQLALKDAENEKDRRETAELLHQAESRIK